jgi:hypothetical protein
MLNLVLDVLREIADDDDTFRVRKHVLKRLDESELDERDTDGTNERAHEGGMRSRLGFVVAA